MIRKIGQIALTVIKIEEAVKFYKEKLNLELLFEAPPKLAFFNVDGIRLMLSEPENEKKRLENSTIYFYVKDINESYEELKKKNVEIIDEPRVIAKLGKYDLWMFFINDNSGNLIGLMQEK